MAQMEFRMEVNNFQRFQEMLLEKQEQALTAVGQYTVGEAKVRTPVGQYDDGRVGGRLRNSIDYKVDVNRGAVHIGTDVEYAVYVEKGTSKMQAQPYLTPAVEENTANIKILIEQNFDGLGE